MDKKRKMKKKDEYSFNRAKDMQSICILPSTFSYIFPSRKEVKKIVKRIKMQPVYDKKEKRWV